MNASKTGATVVRWWTAFILLVTPAFGQDPEPNCPEELAAIKDQLETLSTSHDAQTADLTAAQREASQAKQSVEALTAKAKTDAQSLNDLERKAATLQESLTRTVAESFGKDEKIKTLSTQLEGALRDLAALGSEAKQKQSTIDQLSQREQLLDRQAKSLQNQLRSRATEIEELHALNTSSAEASAKRQELIEHISREKIAIEASLSETNGELGGVRHALASERSAKERLAAYVTDVERHNSLLTWLVAIISGVAIVIGISASVRSGVRDTRTLSSAFSGQKGRTAL